MEGMRGFYKGLAAYLIHVTPNICIVFLIYEKFSPTTQTPPATSASTIISKASSHDEQSIGSSDSDRPS